jgi:flavodoxin
VIPCYAKFSLSLHRHNKAKILMSIKSLIFAIAAMLAVTGCNGQSKPNVKHQEQGKMKNSIVIFFSHAGENYAVGEIKVGNTKIVADYISELTGADQYEIVTHKYDGMAYTPLTKLATEEGRKGELPAYEGKAPDLTQYDTVFIGGPVWWGTYPQVMFTLFRDINLDGKTVVPFTTHEGSGLASCVSDVKEAFPKANVTRGFSIYGHEVRSGKAKVQKWLNELGY